MTDAPPRGAGEARTKWQALPSGELGSQSDPAAGEFDHARRPYDCRSQLFGADTSAAERAVSNLRGRSQNAFDVPSVGAVPPFGSDDLSIEVSDERRILFAPMSSPRTWPNSDRKLSTFARGPGRRGPELSRGSLSRM